MSKKLFLNLIDDEKKIIKNFILRGLIGNTKIKEQSTK